MPVFWANQGSENRAQNDINFKNRPELSLNTSDKNCSFASSFTIATAAESAIDFRNSRDDSVNGRCSKFISVKTSSTVRWRVLSNSDSSISDQSDSAMARWWANGEVTTSQRCSIIVSVSCFIRVLISSVLSTHDFTPLEAVESSDNLALTWKTARCCC